MPRSPLPGTVRTRQCRDAKNPAFLTPFTAAEILNDRVVPFYEEHGIRLCRVLTDRGTEFCGHEYELYLAVEDIDPQPH
jgi:hypothetical protein